MTIYPLSIIIPKHFNRNLIQTHKYGFLLKGKWFIKKATYGNISWLIAPKIHSDEKFVNDAKESVCYFNLEDGSKFSNRVLLKVAYVSASLSLYEGKELLIDNAIFSFYLMDLGDDTLVMVAKNETKS
jgi:hypothetical protein